MLELRASGGVEQDPSKQQDLFGGAHPQALGLQGHTTEERWAFKDTVSCFQERKKSLRDKYNTYNHLFMCKHYY